MTLTNYTCSALDPDPLDPQDFGLLDPDPQKYTDPDPRSKISTKNCKKTFLLLKLSSFLDGSSSFRIKISEKKIKLKIQ